MNKKSTAFALLVTLCLSFVLIGCETVSSEVPASLVGSMLNQPPVLRLSANQPVQTKDGLWVPKVDEVWHSDARYRLLEQQVIDLRVALATKK